MTLILQNLLTAAIILTVVAAFLYGADWWLTRARTNTNKTTE